MRNGTVLATNVVLGFTKEQKAQTEQPTMGNTYFIKGKLTMSKRAGWVGKNAQGMTTIVRSRKDAIKFQMVIEADIDALLDKCSENSGLGVFAPVNINTDFSVAKAAVELSF